jgi:hypothetical protein
LLPMPRKQQVEDCAGLCYMSCMDKTANITIRLAPAHLDALDRIRAALPGVPTRAELLRRLIEHADVALITGNKVEKRKAEELVC